MPKPKILGTRKTVSLPPELAVAVEDFRHGNRFSSESDAIRELIRVGLVATNAGLADTLMYCSNDQVEQIRAMLKGFESLEE